MLVQANPGSPTLETTPESEFPLIPVVAGAAGFVLLVALIVIVCCVVSKRKSAGGGGGGGGSSSGTEMGGGAGGGGIYASTTLTNDASTPEPIMYSQLPSDNATITQATGKEVVAVEWEVDSDEEY